MFAVQRFTRAARQFTRDFNPYGRKEHVPRSFIGPFMRPIIAMGAATVGCWCMWYYTKSARAKEVFERPDARFVLYQYSNCPFCSKVRAYLHSCGEEFEIVEVNPVTKKETKAISDYKKVPLLVADGIQLKESTLITSILHTHFTKGTPISEVIEWYPAVSQGIEDTNKVHIKSTEKEELVTVTDKIYGVYCNLYTAWHSYKKGKVEITYPNKYRVMGYDEDAHDLMLNEAKWRRWIDTHFVHLISPNVYRTWKEALTAFDYFTTNGNFSDFEKSYIRYVGAGAMYMIGKRLRKRHNLDRDVRIELYSGLNNWLRSMKGKKFHGGEQPNLADIEMYGMCSAFYGMPCWQDAIQNTKIEKWYNRMERHLQKKSAIGLTSANPTLQASPTQNDTLSA